MDNSDSRLLSDERRFQLLVDAVTDYAIFMLDAAGNVINWNTGAERIKGYRAEEIVGQHFSQFYTAEDRQAGVPGRALELAARDGKYEQDGWRVRKDGSRFWATVVISAIRDEAGRLIGFAKVTRDITERREARLALETAREQLYQAQKMETVGQLTGGVAHDFNNLLTVMTGSLDLIARRSDDEQIQRLIATAQRAAARGAKLTSQLLAFARRQTLRPERTDINRLIATTEDLLRRACGEAVTFETKLAPGLWSTEIDTAQFQSALLNLIVNARDAMPRGGTLTIETSNVELGRKEIAALGEIASGPYVMVAVRDTGEGMTPEVRGRAIEPFFTTKEIGKGSGLGLSQVYGFARQSNGQAAIESTPGQGTTIRLYLPKVS